MPWVVEPEPEDDAVRAALLAAAEQALAVEPDSVWWRSGFDDVDEGRVARDAGNDAFIVEP